MLIQQIDPEVRTIADLMAKTTIGATLTYDEISAALGRDCRTRDRYKILVAKKMGEEQSGIIFETQYDVGYRRLPGAELAKIGSAGLKVIRNKAKTSIKTMTLGMSAANDLPPDEYRKQLQFLSSLNLIAELAREKNLPQIEKEEGPLPYAVTARMFLEAVNRR